MGITVNAQLEDSEYIRNVHRYQTFFYRLTLFVFILYSLLPEYQKLLLKDSCLEKVCFPIGCTI
jgi:hypothetical protein